MNIEFTEDKSIKNYEQLIDPLMKKHLNFFESELIKIRSGRAHPSMIEDVKVQCYDSSMSIKELGSITVPDPAMIVIEPWDKTVIPNIEKGISVSNLGLNPQNDGEVIRIKLPPMSESRRDQLVKNLHQKLEAYRVSIRNLRKDIQNKIRESEKNKKISEDFAKQLQNLLQKITDNFVQVGDKLAEKKESEIKKL